MNHVLTLSKAEDFKERPVVERVVRSIGQGMSVLLTLDRGKSSAVLASIGHRFDGTRTRVLRVRPPLDLDALMTQLARDGGPGTLTPPSLALAALNALTVLDPACDRCLLLIEDAHLLTYGALRYLDTVMAATPHLHLVVAGQPDVSRLLGAPELPALRHRLALHLSLPGITPGRDAISPQAYAGYPTLLRNPAARRPGQRQRPQLLPVVLGSVAVAAVVGLWAVTDDGIWPEALPAQAARSDPPVSAPTVTADAQVPGPSPVQDMRSTLAALQRRVAERAAHLAELQRPAPALADVGRGADPGPAAQALPPDTLVESLPGTADGAAPSPAPAPEQVSALSPLVPARVVVNYVRGNQAAEQQASELILSLRAKGLDAQGPDPAVVRPGEPAVGYFFTEDAPSAAAVAREAGEAGREGLTTLQGVLPRPGTIRIMLRGGASSFSGR